MQHLAAGADKTQPSGQTATGEFGVLCEKTIAGVNGIAALRLGNRDQLVHIQVSRYATALERHGAVGLPHVQGGNIVFGVDGDRADAQLTGCAGDANGDFAPVGDQQGGEGRSRNGHDGSRFLFCSHLRRSVREVNQALAGEGWAIDAGDKVPLG